MQQTDTARSASQFVSWGWRAGRALLDFLLPPACLCCDEAVDAPGQMCRDCFRRMSFISEPMCQCCGVPFTVPHQGGISGVCTDCEEAPRPFGRARAPFRYDLQSRPVLLAFKYSDRPELALALAPHIVRVGAELLADADVLVPVPLHRQRLMARRYNQAALLAQAVSRLSGVPVLLDALLRQRATVSLSGHDAIGRSRILRGAIAVRPSRFPQISGRRVVLMDDVLTTGATVATCAEVLLDADAASVDVLAAARVPSRVLDAAF
jgi:ComF family protein